MKTVQHTTRRAARKAWITTGLAGLALTASISSAGLAQPEGKQDQPGAAESAPVMLLQRASLDRFLVDEKDAGLARAIEMIPLRLRELPREVPGFEQVPPPVLDLALTLLARPGRLAVTYNPADQTGGGFGVGLIASLDAAGREQAATLQGTVSGLLAQGNAPFQWTPSEQFDGMSETFLPFGMLRYGPRQAGDSWRWEVHFGSVADPDRPFEALPDATIPGDGKFQPVVRAMLDPAPLAPLLNMAKMFAAGQPGAEEGIQQLVESGLVGPDAISYEYQAGYLPDRSVSTWTMRGARKYAPKLNLATQPLAESALAAVPSDATVAWVARFDASNLIQLARTAAESQPEVAEGLDMFEQHTGVDLLDDLVASLGDTVGFYFSDSTGGSNLASGVMFLTLKNSEEFRAANAKLTAALNVALAEEPEVRGRVRGRTWKQGGTEFFSLSFVGLPIPLEPTYAVTDSMVIFGLTPQAAVAAAAQASGRGDKGLASNAAFKDAMPRGMEVTSVTFIDTPRTMRAGYQYVSLAGSALANAVRSPVDAARDPGLIVPTFPELRKGARARVSFSAWRGDDLVKTTYGNRSVLVDAAGMIGAAEPVFPVIGALIGGAAAAVQEQRDRRMMHDWDVMDDMEFEADAEDDI